MLIGTQVKQSPGRFYLVMHDREAILQYRITGGGKHTRMEIYHVSVPMELRGKGVADHLVRDAFKWAEKKGIKVIPACAYVKDKFLKDNPDFRKIVAD